MIGHKPRLLDLFCGAGGAAEGYSRAGFRVVGVDHRKQPRYPFRVIQEDAFDYVKSGMDTGEFDVIHASPPCQAYSAGTGDRSLYPRLIEETRSALEGTGLPWVIENVVGAPLYADYFLCGTALGLSIRRHRVFETNWPHPRHPEVRCAHSDNDLPYHHDNERAYADAMECGWMNTRAAREAIPPAYTALIGRDLMKYLEIV